MDAKLIYTSASGEAINFFQNAWFQVTNVDGLTGFTASISASATPSMDGDKITSIQAQPRGIVFDLRILPNVDVEKAKRFILRTIKPKQKGRLRLTQGDRDLEIEGVVESIAMPRFTNSVTMQISFYCSQPYWQDTENVVIEISRVLDLHYFPLDMGGLAFPAEGVPFGEYLLNMTQTYNNTGDAECGAVITIIALGDVSNPTIYKADGSYIGVNDTMAAGDEIVINTIRGKKSITKNGANILSKIKRGSTFLQLEAGENEFTIDSDDGTEGNVYFVLAFKRRFV